MKIEELNRDKVFEYIEKGVRIDRRKSFEYRRIVVEEQVVKKAEGSALVKIGSTEVIAGCKLDLVEPYPDSPEEGTLIVTVELLPLSSPEFEPGPPDEQAIELARIVDRGIRESGVIDFKNLWEKGAEKVWGIFLDIYSLNDDGNLIDASALAAVLALKNAVFPKIVEGKVKFGELTSRKLPLNLEVMPLTLTFTKIGNNIIADPSLVEEEVADARLSVAVSLEKGKAVINALQKGGYEAFTLEEINNILENAIKLSSSLRKFTS
ncbi:MAG: exosome complex protein Rrp42 [Nanoarchaeota archaeon]